MVIRTYNIPDADMFESGRTIRQLFLDHQAAFVAKDVNVDDPFATNWLNSIESSEGEESDETRTDQQQQETAEVLEQMENGRKKYIEMKYYIEDAFKDKPNIQNKFGLDNYEHAAYSQPQMMVLLKNLHVQSEIAGNKTLLLASGCTQTQIDEIETIFTALVGENIEQNTFIIESSEATKKRISMYNITYGFSQKVNRLSKVVYYGDAVMLNMFNMPDGSHADPDINVKGKVTDAANSSPLKNVAVTIEQLSITTKTNFNGRYHFVSIPAGAYTLKFELSGYGTVSKNITVLASGVVTENAAMSV